MSTDHSPIPPAATIRARVHARSKSYVDIGTETPIVPGGGAGDAGEPRRAPLRWLFGSAMTGLCGMALIGSTPCPWDLNQQAIFAVGPEFSTLSQRDATEEHGVSSDKGDRLIRPVNIVSERQSFVQKITAANPGPRKSSRMCPTP